MTDPRSSEPVEAIAWVVRVNDPAFADWETFELWLAESPAHADAYHAASTAEADAVALLAAAPAAVERVAPARRRWQPWAGGAIAAALVAMVGVQMSRPVPQAQVYETAPGVRRTIALADGSVVTLNGGTRLLVDAADPRALTLDRGEGLFAVRHDAAHPFRVSVGGATVTDIGTAFDIVREAAATRVAVAEGVVEWRREGGAVRLDAGKRLSAVDGASTVEVAEVTPAVVGSWSRGQLAFDGGPLSGAAADLSRSLGVAVVVAPDIAARPVRGVIRLDGDAAIVVPRLAALLGVRATHDGAGWRLIASP